MCKLYIEWKDQIRTYCQENGLNFSEIEKAGKCWGSDIIMFQHIDPERGRNGLRDETPAPIILTVRKQKNKLVFEQTEHTRTYLMN